MTPEEQAKILGGVAYPDGCNWRCSAGHEYPEDFEPDRCPKDELPLTRTLLSFPIDRTTR